MSSRRSGRQGLNLSLRDAAAFAEVAAAHSTDPGSTEALAAYQSRRAADILTRTTAVDLLNRTLLTGFLAGSGRPRHRAVRARPAAGAEAARHAPGARPASLTHALGGDDASR